MPRLVHRLTAVKIAALQTKGLYPDGGGLYLRITAAGTKGWIFRYKVNGQARDMGLGAVASVPLATARALAQDARRRRQEVNDPIQARAEARSAVKRAAAQGTPFRDCAEQLIGSHEPGWRNAKHRAQWRSTMRTYVYPVLGHLPVNAVDTTLVLKVLEPIWMKKPETANRIRGRMEAVLGWATVRGYRDGQNPAAWRGHLDRLLPAKTKVRRPRHHPALPYAELPNFVMLLRAQSGVSARALEFVVLTAVRTSEALQAKWAEVDLRQRMWIIPHERMKGGREHRVPLSNSAVSILKELGEIRQSEFVFPGRQPDTPLSDMSLLMLLRDLRLGFTVHGFRSTFKDWCAECTNVPNFVSEAALAHAVADKVEAAYRRADLFEKRRRLMEAWATYCGREGNIVALRSSA